VLCEKIGGLVRLAGEVVGRLLTDDMAIDVGIRQGVEEGRGMVGRMEERGGMEERHVKESWGAEAGAAGS